MAKKKKARFKKAGGSNSTGRARRVLEYHEGATAQERFMAAMKTIIAAKKGG